MQDLLELPENPSVFSHSCKVSSGKFEPYICSDEARAVTYTCENPYRKNIVTCSDDHLDEFVKEAQGLSLDTQLHSSLAELPYYIPVFDNKVEIIPNLSEAFPVVALTLKDIITGGVSYKAGYLHEEKGVNMRRIMLNANCFKNKKIILFSSGSDTLIESIWYKRNDCDFYSKIAKMGFYAATGFNFSLIVGECPFSQNLNMKRSLISSYLYEQSGLLTIPHIYALTKHQINRWSDWLKLNLNVKYFTVNCQLQNSKLEITHVIQAVKAIFNLVPNVHVILHGFPINRVKEFRQDIFRIHFADSLPHKKARNYRKMTFDRNTYKISYVNDDMVSIAELITHNFNEKLEYLNCIKQEIFELYNLKATA